MNCRAIKKDNKRCTRPAQYYFFNCKQHQSPFIKKVIPIFIVLATLLTLIINSSDIYESFTGDKPFVLKAATEVSRKEPLGFIPLFDTSQILNPNHLNIQILPLFPDSKCSKSISNYEGVLVGFFKNQINAEVSFDVKIDTSQSCKINESEAFLVGLENNSDLVIWGEYDDQCDEKEVLLRYTFIDEANPIYKEYPGYFREFIKNQHNTPIFPGNTISKNRLGDIDVIVAIDSYLNFKRGSRLAYSKKFNGESKRIVLKRTSELVEQGNLNEFKTLIWTLMVPIHYRNGDYVKGLTLVDSILKYDTAREIFPSLNSGINSYFDNVHDPIKLKKRLNVICNDNENSYACTYAKIAADLINTRPNIKNVCDFLSIASNKDKYTCLGDLNEIDKLFLKKEFNTLESYFGENDCFIIYLKDNLNILNTKDSNNIALRREQIRLVISQQCNLSPIPGEIFSRISLLKYFVVSSINKGDLKLAKEALSSYENCITEHFGKITYKKHKEFIKTSKQILKVE